MTILLRQLSSQRTGSKKNTQFCRARRVAFEDGNECTVPAGTGTVPVPVGPHVQYRYGTQGVSFLDWGRLPVQNFSIETGRE